MNDVSTVFTGDGIHAVLTIDGELGRLEFSIHGCTDPVPDAAELEVLLLRRTAEGWLGGVVECLFSRRIVISSNRLDQRECGFNAETARDLSTPGRKIDGSRLATTNGNNRHKRYVTKRGTKPNSLKNCLMSYATKRCVVPIARSCSLRSH